MPIGLGFTGGQVALPRRTFRAADYGSGRTHAPFAAAVAAAKANGSGTVVVDRGGTWAFAQEVLIDASDIAVVLEDGAVIDGSTIAHANQDRGAIRFEGGKTLQVTTVTADIAKGATQITVASSASLAADDWIVIRSSAELFHDDPARATDFKGEHAEIRAIAGTTVTLWGPTLDSYATAGGTIIVDVIAPLRRVGLYGGRIDMGGPGLNHVAAQFRYCRDVRVDGVAPRYAEHMGVLLFSCRDWSARAEPEECDLDNFGYGVRSVGSIDGLIEGCSGKRNRHSFEVGGWGVPVGTTYPAVPDRFIRVVNNRARADKAGPLSTHAHSEFITFESNDSYACGGFISARGKNCRYLFNRMYGVHSDPQSADCFVKVGESEVTGVGGTGLELVGNVMHGGLAAGGLADFHGVFAACSLVDARIERNTLSGFTGVGLNLLGPTIRDSRIERNDLDMAACAASGVGMLIKPNTLSVGNNHKRLWVEGNTFRNPPASAIGVRFQMETGGTDKSQDVFCDRNLFMGSAWTACVHISTYDYDPLRFFGRWNVAPEELLGTVFNVSATKPIIRQMNAGSDRCEGPEWLAATLTHDFASIADGASATQTLTLNGAVLGHIVAVGCSRAIPTGVILKAHVSATNTITIELFNRSGAAVDLANANYYCAIIGR